MERKVGEVFDYNGVALITIEKDGCEGCFFNNTSRKICTMSSDKMIFCSRLSRNDNKNVIFRKIEDMESRAVKLTLEKAKEFYKKGGEFRDLALSAYTKEELTKVELPKTWEEFCNNYKVQNDECYIGSDSIIRRAPLNDFRLSCRDSNLLPNKQAAEQHLALMQLHQLRDCYNDNWHCDWNDEYKKNAVIVRSHGELKIYAEWAITTFLTFKSMEIAKLFLKNFHDLIEKAGDLI